MKPYIRQLYFCLSIGFILSACTSNMPEEVKTAYKQLPDKIDFNLHIRPILSDRCYSCHGPDKNTREADLRLDEEESAFAALSESQGFAIKKGSLNGSQLFHRIISEDEDFQMPPPSSNLPLSDKDKAMLIKWIQQGAEWKEHWAFIPPERAEVPEINEKNWTQYNDIDHFVQAKLQEHNLSPSIEADKERLLRRVTMDLTGLPPTLAEIDSFLADSSSEAYTRVVERLFQTEAYAERMAMEWMDVSRYADSHGLHADGWRMMWPWRDWVIKAFKENMPYDKFVSWQLAGDLYPNATKEQKLATAFNRNHAMTAEGGAIDEEFRLEYVFDRVNTTATAFLGLTMECARCHDHKFDPFSQDEFYQMAAFYNNIKELGMTGDDGNYGPMLILMDKESEEKIEEITSRIKQAEDTLRLTKKELAAQQNFIHKVSTSIAQKPRGVVGYFPFERIGEFTKDKEKLRYLDGNKKLTSYGTPELTEGKFGKAVIFPGGYDELYLSDMGMFEMTEAFSVSAWVYSESHNPEKTQVFIGNAGQKNNFWRGWDFYLDQEHRLSVRLIHSLPHNYIHIASRQPLVLNQWTQVAFSYDGSGKAEGLTLYIDGRKADSFIAFDQLYKSILPITGGGHEPDNRPLRIGKSYRAFTGEDGIFRGKLDELYIFDRNITPLEATWLADIKDDANHEQKLALHRAVRHRSVLKIEKKLKKLRDERLALYNPIDEIMVMEEMAETRPMYVLNRGVYDQPQYEVQPATPTKILAFSEELPKNRWGLAQWIFDDKNPLPARVTVNRYWQLIFGRGLVRTPQDFGSQGDLPTHPELLDYLAVTFREDGWDVKKLLKKMVMSYTYRQSSKIDADLQEADPLNRWLARSPAYRLSAEMIRDNALAASGLLVRKIGGESVKPYQPDGLWIDLGNFSHKLLTYKQDKGDKLYRRSLYTFIRRTSPPPYMTTFDVSSRDKCIVQRENTNTPLQALNLMNDPQFVEAARVFAENMQKEAGQNLAEQINFAFRRATGRAATEKEIAILSDLFETEKARFTQSPKQAKEILAVGEYPQDSSLDPIETAALAVVANTILNHDEAYMKR